MRDAPVGHQCVECAGTGAVVVRKRGIPVITYGLMAINVVMFVFQKASIDVYRELVMWAPGVATGDLYRLLSGAFLHSGIPHLLLNMWALYVVGPRRLNLDVRWIIGFIVLNLVFTFTAPQISWQGHVGGLLTGAAVAGAFGYSPARHKELIQAGFSVAALVALAALTWWRTAGLLAGAT
jgi:membrane associated rhomboid family serine protease